MEDIYTLTHLQSPGSRNCTAGLEELYLVLSTYLCNLSSNHNPGLTISCHTHFKIKKAIVTLQLTAIELLTWKENGVIKALRIQETVYS